MELQRYCCNCGDFVNKNAINDFCDECVKIKHYCNSCDRNVLGMDFLNGICIYCYYDVPKNEKKCFVCDKLSSTNVCWDCKQNNNKEAEKYEKKKFKKCENCNNIVRDQNKLCWLCNVQKTHYKCEKCGIFSNVNNTRKLCWDCDYKLYANIIMDKNLNYCLVCGMISKKIVCDCKECCEIFNHKCKNCIKLINESFIENPKTIIIKDNFMNILLELWVRNLIKVGDVFITESQLIVNYSEDINTYILS